MAVAMITEIPLVDASHYVAALAQEHVRLRFGLVHVLLR